ncbi:hypothetical protein K474DRAFT_1515751 [Panus rudis PR-1116 ss-1]|nr:hypothetical protein K474DRAFT_1515751 [Panus rudis PR-1116 ss-1]
MAPKVVESEPATHATSTTSSRNNILKLNADVLILIFELLQTSDLAHLMQTCRSLYTLGIPLLVKDLYPSLGGDYILASLPHATPLGSLCDFLEAEDGSRCDYVRTVTISSMTDDPAVEHLAKEEGEEEQNSDEGSDEDDNRGVDEYETESGDVGKTVEKGTRPEVRFLRNISRFAKALGRCSNLRSLALIGGATDLLTSFPAITSALASLRSIRRVSVQYGNGRDLLERMQSPVAVVYFNDRPYGQLNPTGHPCPVVDVFRHMTSSLQALHIRHPDLTLPTTSFPKLKTLMISHANIKDLGIAGLMEMFPNLQFLALGERSGTVNVLWRMLSRHAHVIAEIEDMRISNIEIQRTKQWISLDTFCGDICFLYALAPVCPIRQIHLTSILEDSESHMKMWTTILGQSEAPAFILEATTSLLSLEHSSLMIAPSHPVTHLEV